MINTKEIEYIAQLTNLEIDEADIQELTGSIKIILKHRKKTWRNWRQTIFQLLLLLLW